MLRERIFGDPEGRTPDALERMVRWGPEDLRARALRLLALQGSGLERLRAANIDPSPGVRRAAAWGLGLCGVAPVLTDNTEESALAVAIAEVRARGNADPLDALDRLDRRVLHTLSGPRSPVATPQRPALRDRAWLALGAEGRILPIAELRARTDPESLAAVGHPADVPGIMARLQTAGRRGEHSLLLALGLSGDPRALAPLRAALTAIDVDPGRGFTQRRLAAIGLGRLGFRVATRWLLRALEAEARDYEGRPGAGLGIQYPVRADVLWALGELADPTAIPALIAHLSDRQGSAFGGFYLPAMDALRKIGPPAVSALERAAASTTEDTAAHAVSVLGAMGADLGRWRSDPRGAVRKIVAAVEGGRAPTSR